MEECDGLDIKADTDNISNQEQFRIRVINSKMQKIWLKEEVKAKQRSRGRDVTNEIYSIFPCWSKPKTEKIYDSIFRGS
jgi:hypothetical protein